MRCGRLAGEESAAVVEIIVVVGDAAVVVTESKAVSIFDSLIASKLARGGTGQCAQGLAHDGWRVLHVAFAALVSVLECCDLPVRWGNHQFPYEAFKGRILTKGGHPALSHPPMG